jgi:hypothetical protein
MEVVLIMIVMAIGMRLSYRWGKVDGRKEVETAYGIRKYLKEKYERE